MNRRNDVRAMLAYNDVTQCDLAEEMGRSEAWLSKKLRRVSDDEMKLYEEYINKIVERRKN